ncbi:MAG: DMT family transporter [Succinivibrio sp.]|nr:DMT family transporter [Succinivibrio sp.]
MIARELVLLCLIWGMNWVVMKLGNGYFSPVLFAALRFGLCVFIMLPLTLIVDRSLPPRALWPYVALTGAMQIAYNNAVMQLCIANLGSGLSAVLNYTMPLWVALLAALFLGESLSIRKIAGLLISLMGLVLILNIEFQGSALYVLLALSASLVWAAASIVVKRKLTSMSMLSLTAWQIVAGAALLLPAAYFSGQTAYTVSGGAALCLLYNVLLASALAFFLWSDLLRRMAASKLAACSLCIPVVGVTGSVVFLDERLTLSMALGMGLVLLGIWAVLRAR